MTRGARIFAIAVGAAALVALVSWRGEVRREARVELVRQAEAATDRPLNDLVREVRELRLMLERELKRCRP